MPKSVDAPRARTAEKEPQRTSGDYAKQGGARLCQAEKAETAMRAGGGEATSCTSVPAITGSTSAAGAGLWPRKWQTEQ